MEMMVPMMMVMIIMRDREKERVAVTTLNGISIARSYGFLCLHYHALFHTTTAGCFDCFSSSCRVKCLPCLAGFVRTLPWYLEGVRVAYRFRC